LPNNRVVRIGPLEERASLLRRHCLTLAAIAAVGVVRPAAAQATIKVAHIDPLSSPFASGGDKFLKVFAYILQKVNADAGALGKKF
jgi:ABC-type branched-subunit amino acid transport system substrate-binding protein